MKKIVLLILIVILLTGCVGGMEIGWYDISNFVLPDDYEFLALIEKLSMPFWIAQYMQDNFEYEYCIYAKSPYQLWKTKIGDCNDFSLFGTFIAHYNGWDTWQIRIICDDFNHWLGVYRTEKEILYTYNETLYTYTSNQYYGGYIQKDFESIVNIYCKSNDRKWLKYEVYNYDMDIIEEKTQP